jgi:cation transport ATPase
MSLRESLSEPGGNGTARHHAGDEVGKPAISWSAGVILVNDRRLIDAANPGACREFLERAFRLPEVRSVELDWTDGIARVRYQPRRLDAVEVLERLAAVIRGEAVEGIVDEVEPWTPRSDARPCETWFRHGCRLSRTEVASESPGRIRFRHRALAGDRELAHRIEAELTGVQGVSEVQARPLTASLLVRFDPALLDKEQLIEVVDGLLDGPAQPAPTEIHPPAVAFGLTNASLGLAAAGELAVPALLPVSSVLLVVSNARIIRLALHELGHRKIGVPVLHTAIIGGTLGTGHHLVAAAMSWMFKFWRHRHRQDQLQIRRSLMPSLTQRPLFARRRTGGKVASIPADRLRAGDCVVVEKKELVPADGRLQSGPVVIDERLVTGALGLTRKRPGDPIFAGSWPVAEMLEIEVSGIGRQTRAARIGRELAAATFHMPTATSVTARGEEFAQRAVAPTLAAAGVGLLIGDLSTASAILRPDYATGPGLGASVQLMRDTALCAQAGVLIRDPSAFERLAAADVWIFDHLSCLERDGLEVDRIEGEYQNALLQLAATAFRDIADERAIALLAACQSGGISLLPIQPSYRGASIVLDDGTTCITIDDALALGGAPADSRLYLTESGRTVGRIAFRPASRPRLAAAVKELRRQGGVAIGVLTEGTGGATGMLASELEPDFPLGDLSSSAKADLLRSLRDQGLKIAYVGDCRREPHAASLAHVAISVTDGFELEQNPAQVLVLRRDFAWLPALRALSLAHIVRVRAAQNSIVVPNVLCIAGAFFFGFTSLASVVITNLGTWAIYSGLAGQRRQPTEVAPSSPDLLR